MTPPQTRFAQKNSKLLILVQNPDMAAYTLPTAWEGAITGWTTWLKLGGLSPRTVKLRRDHLRSIARRAKVPHPRMLNVATLVALCSEREWSREHRKAVRTSLVSFCEWARNNELMDDNPALQLPRVRAQRGRPRPTPDAVWADLIAAAPPRERVMARLAGEAGLRRAEVAQVHRDDVIRDEHGFALIVTGKGQKQRVVPLTNSLAREVCNYCLGGFLFPGKVGGHMSAEHVGTLISRLMPPGFTMHMLRHRFASRGYRGTRNLRAVQLALGHESIATTEIYTLVSEDEVREVAEAAGDDGDVA